jgi:hypothetical protein
MKQTLKKRRRSWCCVGALALSACATYSPSTVGPGSPPIPVSELANRMEFKSFSILPPQDTKWVVAVRGANSIAFRKQLDSPTHSLLAIARAAPSAEPFDSPETFLNNMKRGARTESPDPRYELLELAMDLDPRFGPFCVKHRLKQKDKHAPVPGGGQTVEIHEMQGYLFAHPYSTNLVVDITWSEKGKPEEKAMGFESTRERFFEGLQLHRDK